MAYYLEEYHGGSVSVEALVMALFELLNTHAKVTRAEVARAPSSGKTGGWRGAGFGSRGPCVLACLPPSIPHSSMENLQTLRPELNPGRGRGTQGKGQSPL